MVAAYPNARLKVILDNLNTHKKNDEWLKRHPLVTFTASAILLIGGGPDADRRAKLLIHLAVEGALLGAYSHFRTANSASGSLSTFTSRTILPASYTMQTLVSLTETSSPAKWAMLRFSF